MNGTSAAMAALARAAGYEPVSVEQPRQNRWLLTLRTPAGDQLLVLAQRRPMLLAADVHDLAELLRLRRVATGFLLAVEGRFSTEALKAAQELRQPRVSLGVDLPPAAGAPAIVAGLRREA